VLFNPEAGLQEIRRDFLEEALARAGADFRLWELDPGLDIAETLEREDPEARAVVVAAGGDGTLCSVARVLVGGKRALGVLPLGTRNHFARDAGLPLDLEEAIRNLVDGVASPIDTGEVDGRVFLNNANLGLYPRFVQERRRQMRRTARWGAILGSAWWVLRRQRHLDVWLDGGEEPTRASIVFVGNNHYTLEGLGLGSRERVDEGVLTLAVATLTGPVSAARLVTRAVLGRLEQDRDYTQQRAREIRVDVRRSRVRVALDGETSWLEPPLQFRVVPGSLLLLRPRAAAAGAR
jgi:diacylglycerol kinase family enzyme